ncbi:pilus assembly protein PilP [Marinimicrobium alkaliphilum]|uniref:pilus assembly protein PilP n=1 Tax=Marinimicrobium alkaliphilum TaxID=2202654 RepID=UPI000DBA66E0|nr:pilus assembly protein PilP [Marinimicrobium alkaliphilum]
MKKTRFTVGVLSAVLLLSACGGSNSNQDLQNFIRDTKARPVGQVDELPTFRPYQPYSYSAMTLRSPFERPVREEERSQLSGRSVEPDMDREREYLERFAITNLRMVGTLNRGGGLWVLIDDGQGGVHAVTQGNYLGRNHGRIVSTSRTQIEVLEIVSDGSGGWVERPRIVSLQERD